MTAQSIAISTDDEIKNILSNARKIAVVGSSQKPWRDSNGIMRFLIHAGYKVFPVNPNYSDVLGFPCSPSLLDIDDKIDIVDVFRRSDSVIPVVHDAIQVKARTMWFQLNVINEEAANLALEAGLHVIMDRCIAIEYRRHFQHS